MSEYQNWKSQALLMIHEIPNEGATIAVMTNEIGRHLRTGIREIRGLELAKRCRFISVRHLSDCYKLYGVQNTIMIDYSIRTKAKAETVMEIERLAAGAAAVMKPYR